MRTKPVGTGPFKFVEFKANESIKLVKNPDYFKKGLPYLDGIEFTIITNRSTAILAFVAGKFDMTFPTEVSIPLLKDVKSQAPNAVCVVEPNNVSTNIIVNSSNPPFDNLDVRRAHGAGARPQGVRPDQFEGQADIGGTMLPAPAGLTIRFAMLCSAQFLYDMAWRQLEQLGGTRSISFGAPSGRIGKPAMAVHGRGWRHRPCSRGSPANTSQRLARRAALRASTTSSEIYTTSSRRVASPASGARLASSQRPNSMM